MKMLLEDKIARIASYLFIIFLMFGFLYLMFNYKWLLYLVASINVIAVFGLILLLIREMFKNEE